jgi:peptidylprolyl isomerase
VSSQGQRRETAAQIRRDTKRRNKQAAAARRAAAQRRRQYAIAAAAALAVIALAGGVVWFLGGKSGKPATSASSSGCASASPSASASSSAAASPSPAASPTGSFPPLPSGADPALATKPVVAPPSGTLTQLKVSTLIAGKGAATKSGQSVAVNYVGVSYKTCEEFDSSWKSGQTFSLTLGQGQVIKGWDQGLLGVKVGSRVQLDIPASLGYGDGDQPTNGSLRFVVDVLSAK